MTLQLDDDQQACVDALDGVYCVLAGPGSGKTTVAVQRYLNLLRHGVPTSQILSLTFTAEAAAEMASRSGIQDAKDVFRTFHSFVLDLMQKERRNVPFALKPAILPWEFEDYELRDVLVRRYPIIGKPDDLKDYISEQKRKGIKTTDALEQAHGFDKYFAQAYRDYETECRKQGWLDFDSLMIVAVNLLDQTSAIRERYRRKYIQVDEAQDTDITQFKLLQLLYGGNIFAVGDENQLIYEWRSAMPDNLKNFGMYFPGAQTMYLGKNYRSTGAIVDLVKKITPVDNGLASRMVSMRECGASPTFTRYNSEREEVHMVLSRLTEPEKTAILARTNRQLFEYQIECFKKNIKHKILGKKAFWEQNEVKKLLALAKAAKVPASYSAASTLKALAIQHRLAEKYRWSGNLLDANPANNLQKVFEAAERFKTIPEFLEYLRKLTWGSRSNNTPALTLSTVHQAKGREWKHVFVVGLTEGVLPNDNANFKEEQRIWFVAASRAADHLHVTCYRQPSAFLNDFKDQLVQYKPEDPNGIFVS